MQGERLLPAGEERLGRREACGTEGRTRRGIQFGMHGPGCARTCVHQRESLNGLLQFLLCDASTVGNYA
jgi:hypothetical protein